jgi:hypothetical protein
VQPAAFEKAAESGMGYQPVYILIQVYTNGYTHTNTHTNTHTHSHAHTHTHTGWVRAAICSMDGALKREGWQGEKEGGTDGRTE